VKVKSIWEEISGGADVLKLGTREVNSLSADYTDYAENILHLSGNCFSRCFHSFQISKQPFVTQHGTRVASNFRQAASNCELGHVLTINF